MQMNNDNIILLFLYFFALPSPSFSCCCYFNIARQQQLQEWLPCGCRTDNNGHSYRLWLARYWATFLKYLYSNKWHMHLIYFDAAQNHQVSDS